MKVLKIFWQQKRDCVYGGVAMQGLDLLGPDCTGADFFVVQDDIVVTQHPPIGGTIKSVMGESIVPVVALVAGQNKVRCVGTAFFVSCTGLLITAAHVVTDPIDRKYGNVKVGDDGSLRAYEMNLGVLVPNNPLFQIPGTRMPVPMIPDCAQPREPVCPRIPRPSRRWFVIPFLGPACATSVAYSAATISPTRPLNSKPRCWRRKRTSAAKPSIRIPRASTARSASSIPTTTTNTGRPTWTLQSAAGSAVRAHPGLDGEPACGQ